MNLKFTKVLRIWLQKFCESHLMDHTYLQNSLRNILKIYITLRLIWKPMAHKKYAFLNFYCSFVKWRSHNEVQSNSEVYSSFASIYINPVVYSLLTKVAWGAFVWVAYINLLISGAKVKGLNYFTKSLHAIFKLRVMGFLLCF